MNNKYIKTFELSDGRQAGHSHSSADEVERQVGPHVGVYCGDCGQWLRWKAKPITLEAARQFVMPFGKHKGKPLSELDDDYLDWLYENVGDRKIAERARLVYEARP